MKFFLFFSHRLTEDQLYDAEANLGASEVVYLPTHLQEKWSQVPPEPETVEEFARPLWDWLAAEAAPGDYAMIQGDFGLSFATVNKAIRLGLVPVYATTRRESSEITDDQGQIRKTLLFKHVRFRRYT